MNQESPEMPQEASSSHSNRRSFIKKIVLGATGLMASNLTSAVDDPKGFMSIDEAADTYLRLKKTIENKMATAKKEQKPLRIFVLESHSQQSANSLAYELMLMDIAKRAGIKSLFLEYPDKEIPPYHDPNSKISVGDKAQEKNMRTIVTSADKNGLNVKGIDNRWPTALEYAEAFRSCSAKFIGQEIKAHYDVPDLKITIIGDPQDQRLESSKFQISGTFNPQPSYEDAQSWVQTGKKKGVDAMRAERNVGILQELKNNGSALIITGKNHGIDLLTPLRAEGQIDVTVSPADRLGLADYVKLSVVSDEQRKDLKWAGDPNNAIQDVGKEFNPNSLPLFIERVIERANQKGRGVLR